MIRWKGIVYPIISGAIALFLFKAVFFVGYVPTASMEPAIKKGSLLIGTRLHAEPAVGDVVVFKWEGRLLVKRVYATEGMVVEHRGVKIRIPEECLYMVGDNRECSYDSRAWEAPFVHRDRIRAKVFMTNTIRLTDGVD